MLVKNHNLFAFGGRRKSGFLFVEDEHAVHEGDKFIVDGLFGWTFEVDGADRKFRYAVPEILVYLFTLKLSDALKPVGKHFGIQDSEQIAQVFS